MTTYHDTSGITNDLLLLGKSELNVAVSLASDKMQRNRSKIAKAYVSQISSQNTPAFTQ